jgi:amino acid permease
MNAIPELDSLRQRWQGQASPVTDVTALRERVGAESRAHLRTLVIVAVATLAVLGFTLLRALSSDEPNTWVSVVFVTCFAVLVWLVAMALSRGTWRPRDESTAAYVDLSIHRCRSVIIAAPVGIFLYVAGLVGSLFWRQRLLGVEWQHLLQAPEMILAGWIGAPAYTIGMLINARRQRRKLAFLEKLRSELSED